MIGNILDNTTELYMIKYAIGEIFSSGGATLYKNPSDLTVIYLGMILTSAHRYIGQHYQYCSKIFHPYYDCNPFWVQQHISNHLVCYNFGPIYRIFCKISKPHVWNDQSTD